MCLEFDLQHLKLNEEEHSRSRDFDEYLDNGSHQYDSQLPPFLGMPKSQGGFPTLNSKP